MKAYTEKQKFWAEHIKAQANSGKTIKAYCQQYDLNRDQFAYYRKRYRSLAASLEPKPRFLPVAVTVPQCLQVKINGVEFEFAHETSASWIAKVIWELGRLHANS